jgi:hypothetical protein
MVQARVWEPSSADDPKTIQRPPPAPGWPQRCLRPWRIAVSPGRAPLGRICLELLSTLGNFSQGDKEEKGDGDK